MLQQRLTVSIFCFLQLCTFSFITANDIRLFLTKEEISQTKEKTRHFDIFDKADNKIAKMILVKVPDYKKQPIILDLTNAALLPLIGQILKKASSSGIIIPMCSTGEHAIAEYIKDKKITHVLNHFYLVTL